MSGHNKWSKLKHTKGKTDAARSKIFTKMGRELSVIAKTGGSDPSVNGRLRDAMTKARKLNMSNDLINRAINKSSDSSNLEEILYEGYAQHGVAVVVECLTDNRNRTAQELRHTFDKYGTGLSTPNSAIFMFENVGQVFVTAKNESEDEIMLAAIEAGVRECEWDEDGFLITCDKTKVSELAKALEAFGETESEILYLPTSTVKLSEDQYASVEKLCDFLDECDDVQDVYHNAIL